MEPQLPCRHSTDELLLTRRERHRLPDRALVHPKFARAGWRVSAAPVPSERAATQRSTTGEGWPDYHALGAERTLRHVEACAVPCHLHMGDLSFVRRVKVPRPMHILHAFGRDVRHGCGARLSGCRSSGHSALLHHLRLECFDLHGCALLRVVLCGHNFLRSDQGHKSLHQWPVGDRWRLHHGIHWGRCGWSAGGGGPCVLLQDVLRLG
mmetsp:Transcript_11322/g.41432  ORF Transcript_11322/g.41432 Transcript_11322/m.41432 type:complete len:209 (-) Transcript_11322:1368-1994(-)